MRELAGKTINEIIEEQKKNPPSIDISGNIKAQIFNKPVIDEIEDYSFLKFLKEILLSWRRG